MFTQHIPRTGKPVGNTKHTPAVRFGAALGTVALVSGFTLIAPAAASADETNGASYAYAEFLSGDVLGTDLGNVAALGQVVATNNGSQSLQVHRDPLTVDALGATVLNQPGGLQLPLVDVVDAGVVNQYAQADKNGESFASTGAIHDDGGIGVGSVASGPAGDLTLDLDSLLANEFASVLTDLKLDLEAVAARADGNMTAASGDYTLADATLSFSSPAISQLTSKVTTALNGVNGQLLNLGGDDGVLGNSIDGILDPVLGVVGSSADVKVVIDADLQNAVSTLLTGKYGQGAVSFNLETGAVIVDLEALMGGELNDLPPNTELLTDAVINQILNGITETVADLADDIVERVELSLRDAHVEVSAKLNLLTAQDPVQSTVCRDIQIPIIGDILNGDVIGGGTSGGGLVGGLLGGLTGGLTGGGSGGLTGVTQGIIGYTTDTVCDLVSTVLPDLRSTVDVSIIGNVDDLIDGSAVSAKANISLLGGTVKTGLNVNTMIGSLGKSLNTSLFSNGGVVTSLVNSLNTGLVNPAVTGLLGESSVATVLHDLVSIKVNVQEQWTSTGAVTGNMFSETAVRVTVGGGLSSSSLSSGSGILNGALGRATAAPSFASTGVATLNVARAVVGPNVQTVIDPGCTQNCGPEVDPDCTNCVPVTDPCVGICLPDLPTYALGGQLAYTGAGVATLIALIVALLAAGAYFARQGYLRTHPKSEL
ncbi:choice-of-anchor G family protein [Salinibacterium sp. M195]|uniref:choice-of-anchor G family protein n=1 Tax=Salinibacterium sp. M195 TaxID=2583374 RepID=UPI001C62DE49|nr:choice-of-anchor G family protein [Salinibacterium sp. M195]QYH34528.1 choice-of-anchor G family protein [Salinibacterium sp. M195]